MNRKQFFTLSTLGLAGAALAQQPTRAPKYEMAPELVGPTEFWIGTKPVKLAELKGKVVVVMFWTFGCINCKRTLPFWTGYTKEYAGKDVVFVSIHTPETEEEKKLANVKAFVEKQKLPFPVLFDSDSSNWRRWRNRYWPATYLIDRKGQVRGRWDGELDYNGSGEYKKVREGIDLLLSER